MTSKVTAMTIMMVSSRAKIDTRTRGLRSGTRASDEDVSGSANGANETRVLGIVTEFLAQAADQHIDGAIVRFPVDSTRAVHDCARG